MIERRQEAEAIYSLREEYLKSLVFLESVEATSVSNEVIEYLESWMDENNISLDELAHRLGWTTTQTERMFMGVVELVLKSIGALYRVVGHRFLATAHHSR